MHERKIVSKGSFEICIHEILESDQKSDESLSPNHSARRALISEICIPFTLSRLRLDNSAGRGVRHSSYFEIHRLVVGMMGGWVALRSYREGGSGVISEQRFDICLTFHIQKAGSIDG